MSVTLTDEQYGAIMHTMVMIARGRAMKPSGKFAPVRREAIELAARDACDLVGWSYSHVEPQRSRLSSDLGKNLSS
jgi:hypothetical protein